MDGFQSTDRCGTDKGHSWDRREIAHGLAAARQCVANELSLSDAASVISVPRSTLRDWIDRESQLTQSVDDPEIVRFFRVIYRVRLPPPVGGRDASCIRTESGRRYS